MFISVVGGLVGALAGVGGAVGRALHRRRGIEHYQGVVRRAGLAVSPHDPNGSTSRLPFDLFAQGSRSGTGPVVHDPARPEARLRVFDYWWEVVDSEGNRTRSWRTCAAGSLPVHAPYLVISPHSLTTRLVGMTAGTDIEVESDEFNRTYYLRCSDRRFAMALCTPGLIELCVAAGGELSIEVHHQHLLVTTGRLAPDKFVGFFRLADAIRSAIEPGLRPLMMHKESTWGG